MLFALLEEHDRAVDDALEAANVSPSVVHAHVKRMLGTGEGRSWEGILVTPRLRKIIALAEERAGDREVEPIHLFDAIRGGGGLAAELLRRNSDAAPG
jgi:hypothetical protein